MVVIPFSSSRLSASHRGVVIELETVKYGKMDESIGKNFENRRQYTSWIEVERLVGENAIGI